MSEDPTGAALVIGGGIAGIQASLDLVDQGFKVYLVEKTPSIGGRMGQLDKTFPTLDCSMCILSPKMVEVGRHPNIELLTLSEVVGLEGEAGNFKVKVHKNPRYIDEIKCTGCGLCAEACSLKDVFPNEFDVGLKGRGAAYVPFLQAVPLVYSIDKKEEEPPCKPTCPANTNVQGYVALIAAGKYKEALEVIRERLPLPAICGRVCPHPCEDECNRGEFDEPISIASLKRFAADYELKNYEKPSPVEKTKDEKIAIIGSGPAGLSAAHDLVKMGYSVTIFEKLPVAGGMMYVGIPRYRLPRDILDAEIDYIKALGVEIKTNSPIESLEALKDYNAVFVACGAHNSMKLNVPGEDSDGVIHGVTFLRDLNLGNDVKIGEKVAIVGGGNVAIDAARSALRLGRKVTVVYRRSRQEMPASEWEIEDAEEEGIEIMYLAAPKKIIEKDGKVAEMECIKMELGEPDSSGRRRPVPIEGSEFVLEVDTVIPAIGQSPDLSFLEDKFETTKWGTIVTNNLCATSDQKIFAGGDATRGPATVVEAIADGKKAALSMDAYLRGETLEDTEDIPDTVKFEDMDLSGKETARRKRMAKLPVEERIKNFEEVELGFTEEEALLEAKRCLNCGICSVCGECIKVCEPDAIDFSQKPVDLEIEVGAIVVSTGFDLVDVSEMKEFGYDYDNVVTALEYERLMCASGPTGGSVIRLSDGEHAKRVAFLQCVGSRDCRTKEYCSAVCCTYATKEAVISKEHSPDMECNIFYMDMRTYGKGFEEFQVRARDEYGVKFTKSRIADISEDEDKGIILRYDDIESGDLLEDKYDLVVLCNGLKPSDSALKLADTLGIDITEYGFISSKTQKPVDTSKDGVFVCGVAGGPMDIPESVAQASGAAARVGEMLSASRNTLTEDIKYPEEKDVLGEEPRIGAFICHCGINIGGIVDVPAVTDYVSTLPNVVYVERNLYTCSEDTQDLIKKAIKEHNLNRVVVASCTPRTHEPLFRNTCRDAGLNQYLFEMANIREHCSWIHMHEPDKATEKAKELVRMMVAKSKLLEPLEELEISVNPISLVIGGGISGLTASLDIATQGFKVHLIEKEEELGGLVKQLYKLNDGQYAKEVVDELISKVESRENITVHKGTKLKDIKGFVGNFDVAISEKGEDKKLRVGTIVVAIGSNELKPDKYCYGENDNILTLLELEKKLSEGYKPPENISVLLCVGCRDEERPYCARYCCNAAIKDILLLKEKNPGVNITVLHNDIRTYGEYEKYYAEALEKGVSFVRYTEEPSVSFEDSKIDLSFLDTSSGVKLRQNPDLLVLVTPLIPQEDASEISKMLKVPLNDNGFFLEAHVKLRPLEFATDGIFLCGTCHSPKTISESIAQASGAASKSCMLLSKETIRAEGAIATIDDTICEGCGLCVSICPYGAIEKDVEKNVAVVTDVLCKGCGTCAASCPANAISARHFNQRQLNAQVIAMLKGVI
ncbi:MAG: NAD(P)-binding protein [Halobacteriota archaeon]|nr:NAD(P)-binding protein [Halobacteriota archaeon]